MKRRDLITLLGGAAAAWPRGARAQQSGKLPTIGYLGASTPLFDSQRVAAFVQRLRELGWIEGRTVAIEYRWSEGRTDRYTEIAAEFVRPGRVTGVPLPKAQPTASDQRRRHVAHGPRCPCLHASAIEGSRAKRPVAKGGPITPCEGRCRRCQ